MEDNIQFDISKILLQLLPKEAQEIIAYVSEQFTIDIVEKNKQFMESVKCFLVSGLFFLGGIVLLGVIIKNTNCQFTYSKDWEENGGWSLLFLIGIILFLIGISCITVNLKIISQLNQNNTFFFFLQSIDYLWNEWSSTFMMVFVIYHALISSIPACEYGPITQIIDGTLGSLFTLPAIREVVNNIVRIFTNKEENGTQKLVKCIDIILSVLLLYIYTTIYISWMNQQSPSNKNKKGHFIFIIVILFMYFVTYDFFQNIRSFYSIMSTLSFLTHEHDTLFAIISSTSLSSPKSPSRPSSPTSPSRPSSPTSQSPLFTIKDGVNEEYVNIQIKDIQHDLYDLFIATLSFQSLTENIHKLKLVQLQDESDLNRNISAQNITQKITSFFGIQPDDTNNSRLTYILKLLFFLRERYNILFFYKYIAYILIQSTDEPMIRNGTFLTQNTNVILDTMKVYEQQGTLHKMNAPYITNDFSSFYWKTIKKVQKKLVSIVNFQEQEYTTYFTHYLNSNPRLAYTFLEEVCPVRDTLPENENPVFTPTKKPRDESGRVQQAQGGGAQQEQRQGKREGIFFEENSFNIFKNQTVDRLCLYMLFLFILFVMIASVSWFFIFKFHRNPLKIQQQIERYNTNKQLSTFILVIVPVMFCFIKFMSHYLLSRVEQQLRYVDGAVHDLFVLI